MIVRVLLLSLGLCIALAACNRAKPLPPPDIKPAPLLWTQDFPLQEIAQQSINTGECGLALWTKSQPTNRIFFAVNMRRSAVINFEGKEVPLTARHERIDLVRGFAPRQLYVGTNVALSLNINIETRQDVLSNAVVRDGVLTLTQASTGRSLVVPVVGVIGCS